MANQMEPLDAERRVARAVERLIREESDLLVRDLNERTITHRLAVHLGPEFEGWHVDCEYNRDGYDPKRLNLLRRNDVASDDVDATTVFPDVIVHRRGTNAENLVVIEAKKSSNARGDEWDKRKLRAFREQLGFGVTVFLLLRVGENVGATLEFEDRRKVNILPAP